MRTPFVAATLLVLLGAGPAVRAETRYSLELARKLVGLASPRVSPDGRSIAFLVTHPDFDKNRNESELWLADAVTGAARALTFERHAVASPRWSPDGSTLASLAWSPDGRQIAIARVPAAQSGRLDSVSVAVLEVASGTLRSLTGATRFQSNPVWSPDGRSIAYWYPRDGRGDINWENEIYLAPAGGGEGRSLTRALDRMVFNAEWLGDGRSLLVAANDG